MTYPDDVETPPAELGLLAVTVAALQGADRMVQTDWDVETFDVVSELDGQSPIAGVILHSTRSVAFYAVWDDEIPPGARTAVAEFAVRANPPLTTCALEFSVNTGILALRSIVHLGNLPIAGLNEDVPGSVIALPRAAFGELLTAALAEVESTFSRFQDPIKALIAGDIDARAAAVEVGQPSGTIDSNEN